MKIGTKDIATRIESAFAYIRSETSKSDLTKELEVAQKELAKSRRLRNRVREKAKVTNKRAEFSEEEQVNHYTIKERYVRLEREVGELKFKTLNDASTKFGISLDKIKQVMGRNEC
jgi:hypothetical protein